MMRVEVTTEVALADLRSASAAFVKGNARLVFDAHPDRSRVLRRAADMAEKFDLDLYVDGKLSDPYEVRDRMTEGGQ